MGKCSILELLSHGNGKKMVSTLGEIGQDEDPLPRTKGNNPCVEVACNIEGGR